MLDHGGGFEPPNHPPGCTFPASDGRPDRSRHGIAKFPARLLHLKDSNLILQIQNLASCRVDQGGKIFLCFLASPEGPRVTGQNGNMNPCPVDARSAQMPIASPRTFDGKPDAKPDSPSPKVTGGARTHYLRIHSPVCRPGTPQPPCAGVATTT